MLSVFLSRVYDKNVWNKQCIGTAVPLRTRTEHASWDVAYVPPLRNYDRNRLGNKTEKYLCVHVRNDLKQNNFYSHTHAQIKNKRFPFIVIKVGTLWTAVESVQN